MTCCKGIPTDKELRYSKVRNVKSPQRANATDAGIDMFIPTINKEFKEDFEKKNLVHNAYINDLGFIEVPPNGRACIPSGCHFDIEEGYALIANNKSGVATKLGLVVGACIDKDTKISTNIGLVTAEELTSEFVKTDNIKIMAYNEEKQKYEFCDFDGFRHSNTSEVYEVEFEDGSKLICSGDHSILTENGWETPITHNHK